MNYLYLDEDSNGDPINGEENDDGNNKDNEKSTPWFEALLPMVEIIITLIISNRNRKR